MLQSRFLRWTLVAIVVVLVLYLSGTLIGLSLPAEHAASRRVVLEAVPPEAVWRTVLDPETQAEWRTDIRRIEVLPSRTGGPVWRERYRNGRSLVLATSQLIPQRRWERRVADPRAPFSGTWTLSLTPAGSGTLIDLKETAEVPNPFFRFVAKYIVGHGRAVDSYLRFLARRFGQRVELQ